MKYFLLLGALALAPTLSWGAPFLPDSDETVLERLPTRPGDPSVRELRALRERLAANPGSAEVAVDLGNRYFRLAVREGDPRYVGYAQSTIARWSADANPPTDVLILRAGLAQFLHDFTAALKDLDHVLAREPAALDAWSYRAVINMVMARYDDARRDCRELVARVESLYTLACEPTVDALTGHAQDAYRRLTDTLEENRDAPPNYRLWVRLRLAEISQRLGHEDDADLHYRAALQLSIDDQYLLATYAEHLLDRRRYEEVVKLLRERTRNDVLLLRLALAEKALRGPDAAAHQAVLQARIDAARLRKDKLHLSDEAWFTLVFLANPAHAVRLARENWDSGQREPSDARILFETALAANDRAMASPALEWLRRSGNEDVRLRKLAASLDARQ